MPTPTAYYNEFDPKAAAWLRELIREGLIAPGDVDDRSIADVHPADLIGYIQCHFFAGIGGWSYALRLAGWPDERPVWTGSCPCQPFSAAGRQEGAADARHLWPEWFRLIRKHRPIAIFGEQVAAALRHGWLDLVSTDLEGAGYAIGSAVLGAHSVGAPHIRQRLFFVADADDTGSQGRGVSGATGSGHGAGERATRAPGAADGMGNTAVSGSGPQHGQPDEGTGRSESHRGSGVCGATAGFWHHADWLPCIDGKARPVESGTFPLAHGLPARVGRLRGYGNAIVPQVAAEFIRASVG